MLYWTKHIFVKVNMEKSAKHVIYLCTSLYEGLKYLVSYSAHAVMAYPVTVV